MLKRMENQNPGMNIFDFKLLATEVKLRASCKKKKKIKPLSHSEIPLFCFVFQIDSEFISSQFNHFF